MKPYVTATAVLVCALWTAGNVKADVCDSSKNLVVNCGFETGDLTGWVVAPSGAYNYYYGVDNADAYTGNFGAFLGGTGSYNNNLDSFALLGQFVPTVAGRPYVFSYDWAHDTSSDPGATPDDFFAAGINGIIIPGSEQADVGDQAFTNYTYTFLATSNSTLIEFEAEDSNFVFSLDDVSLSLAPEPASLALSAFALAAVGLFLLRRRRNLESSRA